MPSGTPTVGTSTVHGGTYAVNGITSAIQCTQTVTGLTPNTSYTLRMYGNGTGSIGQIGYTLPGGSSGNTGNAGNNTWSLFTASFTTGASDTSATIYFKATGGTWNFDDGTLS
jgi:hypothetical protein